MRLEELGKLEKKIHFIGNRTRGLPACSKMPQPIFDWINLDQDRNQRSAISNTAFQVYVSSNADSYQAAEQISGSIDLRRLHYGCCSFERNTFLDLKEFKK
jgi:hypothetical protein